MTKHGKFEYRTDVVLDELRGDRDLGLHPERHVAQQPGRQEEEERAAHRGLDDDPVPENTQSPSHPSIHPPTHPVTQSPTHPPRHA